MSSTLETHVAASRVAIIGRPNVGKSTLFNRLTRSRKAVVKNQPGVTRDIQIETTEWWGHTFEVVDTGGLTDDKEGFSSLIKKSVTEFLVQVDLLILVVDGRAGLLPEDRDVVRLAKASGKPFLFVVNKVDKFQEAELLLSEFYEFGIDLLPAAFERDFQVDEIVEWIIAHLPEPVAVRHDGLRLTIVGKPNAGKSSLCNHLLGEERMLVSEIAGTTVDAVEAPFRLAGEDYILVDTAGLRKAGKQRDGVEALSAFKSRDAIGRSDLVLLVVDGTVGLSHQDARIVEYCVDRHKAMILVVNKYDLAKNSQEEPYRKWFKEHLEREFHFFTDIPYVLVSAKTGSGMASLFQKIAWVRERLNVRISTSKLNKFFTEVIKQAPSPVYATENVKFYYLTQTQQKPPSFIAFANHPEGVTPAYRRFLSHKIQDQWDLRGIPVRIFVLPKGGVDGRS